MHNFLMRICNCLTFYFKTIYSKEFRDSKHKRFRGYQIAITTICAVFQAIWLIKDLALIGLGQDSHLILVVIGRLLGVILLMPYYILCHLKPKLTATFSNTMLYLNITGQFIAMCSLGTPFTGEANIIFNFAIFTLHYASASGIAHIFAQILYTLSFNVLCQTGLGLFEFVLDPQKLFFTGYVFTCICLSAAAIFRVAYFKSWLNEEKLKRAAITDTMSGCYNRKRIAELTDKNECMQDQSTVIMLDIDHFKQFNDTKGHDFGDRVIMDTARMLWSAFPRANIIRYGGDEFLIIEHEIMSLETIDYLIGKNKFRSDVTYSVGFSHGFKDDNLYGIIKQADLALYESKKVRGTVTSYQDLLDGSHDIAEQINNQYKYCF